MQWFGIVLGGALGAMARYYVTRTIQARWSRAFPLATFVINIVGAFFLGLVVMSTKQPSLLHTWIASTVGTGFLGAFTTFSTYMVESMTLVQIKKTGMMFMYMLSSLVIGLLLAYLGMHVAMI
nr:fluoride efflux transporter CrcB [Bacilli bacterium]